MSDIQITIKSSGDAKHEISIAADASVSQLKEKVAAVADVPAERQRLIYSGKVLKDDQTLESYKVQSGHTIHLVKSAAKPSGVPTDSTAASSAGADNAGRAAGGAAATGAPTNIALGQGSFNPLADLTGARYAGYAQLPSASMFGPDGGMNAGMPDPDQMSEMMSNPMFQESMSAMLSNPQMLDFVINQNPQLRAMGPQAREMLQSPMFRQMMSNPEMMRLAMEMGRASGMGGFGGGNAFAAPGANPTVEGNGGLSESTGATGAAAGTGGNTGNGAPPANPFASLFSGMPSMDQFETDSRPPEERFQSQLGQLNDMGFFDFDQNVAALRRSGGSVQGAIEYLLQQ